jgi:hypothetical protein
VLQVPLPGVQQVPLQVPLPGWPPGWPSWLRPGPLHAQAGLPGWLVGLLPGWLPAAGGPAGLLLGLLLGPLHVWRPGLLLQVHLLQVPL